MFERAVKRAARACASARRGPRRVLSRTVQAERDAGAPGRVDVVILVRAVMYWGLTALDLLGRLDVVDADEIVDFV